MGASATVLTVGGSGPQRQHLLDMGLIPGVNLTLVQFAPMGDPIEVRIHGYALTLRLSDAAQIEVAPVESQPSEPHKNHAQTPGSSQTSAQPAQKQQSAAHILSKRDETSPHGDHPGLGEGGIYHDSSTEHPLPEGTVLTFALAGNQNCGKTTLFNRLTGSNQHVGNFPGVTVESKSGPIKDHPQTLVTDLPGIYSLSPYSSEEVVSRSFILDEKPAAIINIVDATNIERNLYLTMQLLELDTPMALALNMMDEVAENGGSIRINELEEALGIPVVPISASKNQGIEELVNHVLHIAKFQEKPKRWDFCDKDDHGGALHRCLHGIMHLVEDHAEQAGIPLRFAASKLVEGDELVQKALGLDQNELEAIEHIVEQMEAERGLDRAAAIADMRFLFINKVCAQTVVKPSLSKGYERSRTIDKILTGRYTAIPAFIAIMAGIFWLTFYVLGPIFQDWIAQGIEAATAATSAALEAWEVSEFLQSLVIDGIFNGVGAVVAFVPIIVILFFFLSLLEDSGYMARVAFVMDKPLRHIGLSGRSIVPMLVGFGCTVPAVMASRTLPSERDRRMTILLTPFMSCSTKLTIYSFLALAFFPAQAGLITFLLYLLGIVVAVGVAAVIKKWVFKGEAVPFVMELPSYRMPGAKNVGHLVWDKTWDFVSRAFTIIFLATVAIWFLQKFDFGLNIVNGSDTSILAVIASVLVPILIPLGLGDWRISSALITGFLAKESVVSTLTVIFGSAEAMTAFVTPSSCVALLVFCLLYTPCVAAIAAIRRELGHKWALGIVFGQCAIAWIIAFIIRGICLLCGMP